MKSEPLPPREIAKRANVPLRTVSFALRQLRRHELCRRIPNFEDMRRPLYVVDTDKARSLYLKYHNSMS